MTRHLICITLSSIWTLKVCHLVSMCWTVKIIKPWRLICPVGPASEAVHALFDKCKQSDEPPRKRNRSEPNPTNKGLEREVRSKTYLTAAIVDIDLVWWPLETPENWPKLIPITRFLLQAMRKTSLQIYRQGGKESVFRWFWKRLSKKASQNTTVASLHWVELCWSMRMSS